MTGRESGSCRYARPITVAGPRPRSALSGFLAQAFPESDQFPEDCWIRRVHARNFDVWADVLACIDSRGARADLTHRLAALAHPPDRPHNAEQDRNLVAALVEAEAFAWTSEQGFSPRFVFDEGCPDLSTAEGVWVEAKLMRPSLADRAAWEEAERAALRSGRGPHRSGISVDVAPGFLSKFDYQVRDAMTKWRRQETGSLVVYVCVNLDANVETTQAFGELRRLAEQHLEPGLRIVAVENHRWAWPLIDVVG